MGKNSKKQQGNSRLGFIQQHFSLKKEKSFSFLKTNFKLFNRNNFTESGAGFTLIELLVVISIISLMSSVLLVATVNTRKKARDTVRRSTLNQLAKALELYYEDNNTYPATPAFPTWHSSEAGDDSSVVSDPDNYIPGLAPKYIAKLPHDPLGGIGCGTTWHRSFLYMSDGRDYKLLAACSNEMPVPIDDPLMDPQRDGGSNISSLYDSSNPNSVGNAYNPLSCNGTGDGSNAWSWAVDSGSAARCW